MKNKIIVLSLFALALLTASPVRADDEVRKLVVDLKAKGFTQANYQDNLDSSNIIFGPGDKFQIQLKVSNLGNRNQTNVKVTDILPNDVTVDVPSVFTIPQITPGEDYIKNITVTIKAKPYVYQVLTNNSIRFAANTDAGTNATDYTSFYTNNGALGIGTTATIASASTAKLPDTGSASTLIFGSAIAAALAYASLKLRALARGY